MSTTLNLVDRLLLMGRNLQHVGRGDVAARLLTRLSGWRELPDDVAEETHARLAEIHIEQDELKQARRHLVAALAYQPDCAHYHYLLAVAVEDDPKCSPQRAGVHFRRCLALNDEHPDYLCDYGHYAMRHGQKRTALKMLRRAADMAPDDPDTLGRVLDGLRYLEKLDEAKTLLRAALFRNPRERRFRDLWTRHQFELLHASQQPARQPRLKSDAEPVILPFARPKKRPKKVGGKTIRTDGPSEFKGPSILPLHAPRKKDA